MGEDGRDSLEALEPLVGEWTIVAAFKDIPDGDAGGRVTFEWLSGNGKTWEHDFDLIYTMA